MDALKVHAAHCDDDLKLKPTGMQVYALEHAQMHPSEAHKENPTGTPKATANSR